MHLYVGVAWNKRNQIFVKNIHIWKAICLESMTSICFANLELRDELILSGGYAKIQVCM